VLFRPEENALRLTTGAERMCMAAPSVEQFVEAVKQTVLANKRWVRLCFCLNEFKSSCFSIPQMLHL
jgi:branched-subunit amino acid aminotransferase/4-amino-4-deoxychorismate lyase